MSLRYHVLLLRSSVCGLLLLLSACAGRMSPAERAAIHSVHIVNPRDGVKSNLYGDTTSEAALRASSSFGLVGALIGGGIAAADIHAGVSRWANVTNAQNGLVLQVFRDKLRENFGRTAGVQINPNLPGDATLEITDLSYGVSHSGHQRFNASVSSRLELTKPNGKLIWSTAGTGLSEIAFTLEEYRSHPGAYSQALTQAADNLAKRIVLSYQGIEQDDYDTRRD